jgi:hypothetical protein
LPGSAVAFAWALLVRFWVTLVELGFVAAVTLLDRGVRARRPQADQPDDGPRRGA